MIKVEFTKHIPQDEKIIATLHVDLRPHEIVSERYKDDVRHLFVNIGASRKSRERAGGELFKRAASGIEKQLVLDFCEFDILSGILLASFRFDTYKTFVKPEDVCYLEKIVVVTDEPEKCQNEFSRIQAQVEGVFYARRITSEPSNILFPMAYATRLLELQADGIEVEILDEKALKEIGMTAMLAVGQGSPHPSSVVCMRWKGDASSKKPIVLVGKGVCFDSGGLCIKPAVHQREMKWDKAGAGVVAGTMKALAKSNSLAHVVGIVGLVENMPDGNAIKPGDVIKTMSGQTIEIVDTDAEGRLVLADCLYYAERRFQPETMVDLGTLTIETFASLGSAYAGLYSDDALLAQSLLDAGKRSGDELWRLPMGEHFANQLESSVADMKNLGDEHWGENGAAAEFLKRFVKTSSWAHIDIAGVSWTKEDLSLCRKGVTGYGVRLLEEWIYSLTK
jgi:leucyl aminopeptidase